MRIRLPSLASAVAAFAMVVSCTERQQNPGVPTEPSVARGGPSVKTVNVTPSSASIGVNGTVQLTATAQPPKAATGGFTWSTSNAAVATVSASGLVTGVAAGTATIRATSGGASGISTVTVTSVPPPSNDPVLVGAGDIASCSSSGDEATAALLDNIAGTVFTLGDNVYDNGTLSEYTNCYGPSWGRHRSRTAPTPGNHEYNTPNATGYYAYFGAAAGDPSEGYYSYDLGAWHIIVLNSGSCTTVSCAAGSAQDAWLRADLQAHQNVCTLAYWHHPRFNSGASHGNYTAVSNFWDALYQYGADVILNGHEHIYERFAPQTPAAVADAMNGIRQFTVGTGGRSHYAIGTIKANSQVREGNTYGVLKLTLHATSYDWQFVPVAGATFTDSGTGNCH